MPYNPASATRSMEVVARKLILGVDPPAPWTGGQSITLRARLFEIETPVAGVRIYFRFYPRPTMSPIVIGSVNTDATGAAYLPWKIPFKVDGGPVPCGAIAFDCYGGGATSDKVGGLCAYPTRISISAPGRIGQTAPFTISGKLEYESDEGVWSGLAGKTVTLYYDGTKIGDVTTGSDGSYSKPNVAIPEPGTYTLKAVFAGEGLGLAPAAAESRLTVPGAGLIASLAAVALGGLAATLTAR